MAEAGAPPVAEMSFEAALAELEAVVARLEGGQVPLDESIALYARGAELRAHCEARLKAAEVAPLGDVKWSGMSMNFSLTIWPLAFRPVAST